MELSFYKGFSDHSEFDYKLVNWDLLDGMGRYWKLSLLVHPDKCSHPQAQEAFMALNKAFKDLQDPTKVNLNQPVIM